eukprot:tig00000769_g4006.t1
MRGRRSDAESGARRRWQIALLALLGLALAGRASCSSDSGTYILLRLDEPASPGVWFQVKPDVRLGELLALATELLRSPEPLRHAFDRAGVLADPPRLEPGQVVYFAFEPPAGARPAPAWQATPPPAARAAATAPPAAALVDPSFAVSVAAAGEAGPGWMSMPPKQVFEHSLQLYHKGDLRGALAVTDRLYDVDPWMKWAHMNAAVYHLQLGELRAAYGGYYRLVYLILQDCRVCPELPLCSAGELLPLLRSLEGYLEAEAWFRRRRLVEGGPTGGRGECSGAGEGPRLVEAALHETSGLMAVVCDYRDSPALLSALQALVAWRAARGEPPATRITNFLGFPWPPPLFLAAARNSLPRPAGPIYSFPPPLAPPLVGRLRVGYFNRRVGYDAVSHANEGIFGLFDRSRFELICYTFSDPADPSVNPKLIAAFERVVNLARHSDAEAAAAINADQIHVLLDGSYMKDAGTEFRTEILAQHPAPVQIAYMDHPGTSGAPYMEYMLADRYSLPPDHFFGGYTEKLLVHPVHYVATSHASSYPHVRRPEARPSRRAAAEVGWLPPELAEPPPPLGNGRVLLANNNQFRKIDSEVLAVWANVLRRSPRSLLWTRALPTYQDTGVAPLGRELLAAGVASGRVAEFKKQRSEAYLQQAFLADLMLDTFLYNAVTVGADFAWQGVPLVTTPRDMLQNRAGGATITQAGAGWGVAGSVKAYEDLAVRLAEDGALRSAVRAAGDAAVEASPEFDCARWAAATAAGAAISFDLHAAGEPPHHLVVAGALP